MSNMHRYPFSSETHRVRATRLAMAILLLALGSSLVLGMENEDCMMCHEDPELTGTVGGRELSVYVDAGAFAGSVHGEIDCIMCHQDLDGADIPHDDDLEKVDCSFCHEEEVEEQASSLHAKAATRGDPLAPDCVRCHSKHDIRSHREPGSPTSTMNVPFLCGRCHKEGAPVAERGSIPQDHILENYSLSIHGEGLFKQGLTVTAVCTSCHTAHAIRDHEDPESSIHHDNIAATCTTCHARIEQVHRKVIEGRRWTAASGQIPACVDCHTPHKIRRVFYPSGAANRDCLVCHQDRDLAMTRDGATVSLYVDEIAYSTSRHATVACAQCHTEVSTARHRPCETVRSGVDCGSCHTEQNDQYAMSTHGTLFAAADPDAPGCLYCHDAHATLDQRNPTSRTFPLNVPDLCEDCHREGEKASVRNKKDVLISAGYEMSIHGKGLRQSGLTKTATCSSCHSAHKVLPASDERSTVHPGNIALTCGECHHGIEEIFQSSIHWPKDGDADHDLPTCEDCHTSHTISRTDQEDFRFRMMDQCGRCHQDEAETFFDTFHGKVSRLGSSGVATCYDCHGTHSIHAVAEAASTLSRVNVVETCKQCHPGAHMRFAAGYLTHATHHDPDKYPFLFITFWAMTALLVGTLTFALLHTFFWLLRLYLSRDQWKQHRHTPGEKMYRRFSRLQRTCHMTMLVSFFTLAITGMILKFSYMSWAQVLADLLGSFETTGFLHRLAAVALFVTFVVHLWDLRRKKKEAGVSWLGLITGPNSILFNRNDIREVVASMKWFFGVGPRPKYGRYTYWEKFDYFAVFWGIAVIGLTGLVLWFPEWFTHILPGWSVNIATIIHSDEALLAVAFIFTVHFFNTHFRPDKFPMDPVIFTGRVPLEELKHDKPAEYEALKESGELAKNLVDPFPKPVETGFKIFGFIALTIGLTLIALIVYAMLVGYR